MNRDSFKASAYVSTIEAFSFVMMLQGLTAVSASAQTRVSLQPLAQQVRQVETTLAYLGQPLTQSDHARINQAVGEADEAAAVSSLEQILDKYTLAIVDIIPRATSRCSLALRRLSWSRPEHASSW